MPHRPCNVPIVNKPRMLAHADIGCSNWGHLTSSCRALPSSTHHASHLARWHKEDILCQGVEDLFPLVLSDLDAHNRGWSGISFGSQRPRLRGKLACMLSHCWMAHPNDCRAIRGLINMPAEGHACRDAQISQHASRGVCRGEHGCVQWTDICSCSSLLVRHVHWN
jgi:hypothetical protein